MKYNRQLFCISSDKVKNEIVEEELRLETHNGTTKDDLLMLLEWAYKKDLEKNDGWIPVDERLPEESGYYLTTHEDCMAVYHYSKRHKAFNSYDQFSDRDNLVTCLSVDAWQPLPKPYRPERSDKERK